ncbi:uncharacterized protein LOC122006202 isoform X2 [Zingiber officinale]|uniref:uncharacterized protein LOC122006202 isoform X2 n=1 Tax=Zingiber officinale TaxID=94328 RepID=UPI001C4CBD26|nr:uncharacterized protein LOC122006202 isoform X2 [Zingiber officinale]
MTGQEKKMKVLCLHGFRTSGGFLRKQISKWDPSIFQHFQLDYPDGIFLAGGKSDIEGVFPPPYYEWFQYNKGAVLAAVLAGYQAQGQVLKDHPPIKFLVSISGSMFRDPSICGIAYRDPIKVKSVHFIGEKDWLKLPSEDLASAFDNPLVLRHPQGHTVPRLDEGAVKQLSEWTESIFRSNLANDHASRPGSVESNTSSIEQGATQTNSIISVEDVSASA